MDEGSSEVTEREVVIPAEQWERLSEEARDELRKRLRAAFGRPVVVRPGTPPPGAVTFRADGAVERVPEVPPRAEGDAARRSEPERGPVDSIPPPTPGCKGETCVQQAFVRLRRGKVAVTLVLTDRDGQVVKGKEPRIDPMVMVNLYRLEAGGAEVAVIDDTVPRPGGRCGTSLRFPWAEGRLAAACMLPYPAAGCKARIAQGDRVRIEVPLYGFEQVLVVE